MLPMTTGSQALIAKAYQGLQKTFQTFCFMLAFDPIIPNLIALALCSGALMIMYHPALLPALGKYHVYLTGFLQALGAWQIILSARKSLLLPLLAMALAGLGLMLHGQGITIPWVTIGFLKDLMLTGLLGMALSIFTIR